MNFGTNVTITWPPWKTIASCSHLPPIFGPALSDGVIWIFSLPTRCRGNEFWDKIDYNSAPVKNNCALFAPTSLFSGPRYPIVSFKFLPCDPVAMATGGQGRNFNDIIGQPMATNFGTKFTTTRPPWKIIAPCLHLPPYFRACAIRCCHSNFSRDPVAMATNFGTKLTITRLLQKYLHAVFTYPLFSGVM